MVGSGVGAKHGILFKTAASLESAGRVSTVVLDKTGTITKGEPSVTDVLPADGITSDMLLQLAVTLEANSEHPLAHAIRRKAEEIGLRPETVSAFTVLPGNGLRTYCGTALLCGGSLSHMETVLKTPMPAALRTAAESMAQEGKTPLAFSRDGKLLGIIAVADTIKEDSPDAIRQLREMGIRVVMLTGDNARTAAAVGTAVGVDEVIAGVLPDGKEEVIRTLRESGHVAMVGDGINDAPALAAADIGISMGSGTDIAIETSSVTLAASDLTALARMLHLSRLTMSTIRQNLFWALIYNIVGIPLAACGYLSPLICGTAMAFSSVSVVLSSLRLAKRT
jgi:Cu2+-exporting ATPase